MSYWRYTYILTSRGTGRTALTRAERFSFTVQGVIFFFGREQVELGRCYLVKAMVEDLVAQILEQRYIFYAEKRTVEGDEYTEVAPHEAKGLGFYRVNLLINDKPYRTVDLRYRR